MIKNKLGEKKAFSFIQHLDGIRRLDSAKDYSILNGWEWDSAVDYKTVSGWEWDSAVDHRTVSGLDSANDQKILNYTVKCNGLCMVE